MNKLKESTKDLFKIPELFFTIGVVILLICAILLVHTAYVDTYELPHNIAKMNESMNRDFGSDFVFTTRTIGTGAGAGTYRTVYNVHKRDGSPIGFFIKECITHKGDAYVMENDVIDSCEFIPFKIDHGDPDFEKWMF